MFTDDGDTPDIGTLSGRVLANNFVCTDGNTVKDFSLAAYGLVNADFSSFYNICKLGTVTL